MVDITSKNIITHIIFCRSHHFFFSIFLIRSYYLHFMIQTYGSSTPAARNFYRHGMPAAAEDHHMAIISNANQIVFPFFQYRKSKVCPLVIKYQFERQTYIQLALLIHPSLLYPPVRSIFLYLSPSHMYYTHICNFLPAF